MTPLSHVPSAPTALVHLLCRFMLPIWLLLFTVRAILMTCDQYYLTQMMKVEHVQMRQMMSVDYPSQAHINFGDCMRGVDIQQVCSGPVLAYLENPDANLNGLYRAFTPQGIHEVMIILYIVFFPTLALCLGLVATAVTTFFRTCSFCTSFGDIRYLQVTLQIKQSKCWVRIVFVMQCLFPLAVLLLWFACVRVVSGTELARRSVDFVSVFLFSFGTCFAAVHSLAATDPAIPQWYRFFDNPGVAHGVGNIIFVRGAAGMVENNVAFMHRVMKALMSSTAIGAAEGSELATLLSSEHAEAKREVLIELQRLEASEKAQEYKAKTKMSTPIKEPLLSVQS